ncbi:hypothetical protein, partial [Bathymodiolus platifrons methanotrophic gill symbiont]
MAKAPSNGSTAHRDKILASRPERAARALRIGTFPFAYHGLLIHPGLTAKVYFKRLPTLLRNLKAWVARF